MTQPLRFLDPMYGLISVHDDDRSLFFTPEFQRLRYVRMCNINSLFLTGASEPSRFEHCVGTYHLSNIWIDAHRPSRSQAKTLRAAALLHDWQTPAFGHSFQYVLEDNEFDARFEHGDVAAGSASGFHQRVDAGRSFAGRQFSAERELGAAASDVYTAIKGEGPLGPLISGTLDLDNLDNVFRLAFHMGLCSDADRAIPAALAPRLWVNSGRLTTTSKYVDFVQRWCDLRTQLYEYLLLDRGEFAAKAMLTLATELAVEQRILGPDSWRYVDDEFLSYLENASAGEAQEVSRLSKRLRVGDLFPVIGVWTTPSVGLYDSLNSVKAKREIEKLIEDRAEVRKTEKLKLCLHPIKDVKKTRRSVQLYLEDADREITIGTNSSDLHVALFATNERSGLSARTMEQYRVSAEKVFKDLGATELRGTPEPLYPDRKEPVERLLI